MTSGRVVVPIVMLESFEPDSRIVQPVRIELERVRTQRCVLTPVIALQRYMADRGVVIASGIDLKGLISECRVLIPGRVVSESVSTGPRDAESTGLTIVSWPGMTSRDCTAIAPGKPGSDWPPSMPGRSRKIKPAEAANGLRERSVSNAAPHNAPLKGHPGIRLESVWLQASILPSQVNVSIRFYIG